MKKGVTKSGFEYELTDERLNNFELFDVMAEVDENSLLIPKMLTLLLGKDQKKALYDHLRDEKGIVPIEKVTEEIKEIFDNEKVKN